MMDKVIIYIHGQGGNAEQVCKTGWSQADCYEEWRALVSYRRTDELFR